jgi:hypothetical protein
MMGPFAKHVKLRKNFIIITEHLDRASVSGQWTTLMPYLRTEDERPPFNFQIHRPRWAQEDDNEEHLSL